MRRDTDCVDDALAAIRPGDRGVVAGCTGVPGARLMPPPRAPVTQIGGGGNTRETVSAATPGARCAPAHSSSASAGVVLGARAPGATGCQHAPGSEPRRAAALIGACIERFPQHPDRRWWLPFHGDLLLELGLVEQARAVFAQCVETCPDSPGGYSGLARAAQVAGDAAAAEQAMAECIRRFPQHAERRWWLPFHGNLLGSLGSWDAAEAAFAAAVRDFPDEPAGHSGLARAAVHRGDWPRAAALLRACIASFPAYQDMTWWEKLLADCEVQLTPKS